MGKRLTEVTDNDVEVIRYNGFGFKDSRGKYVLYDDHVNRLNALNELIHDIYKSMIMNVNDMFK